MTDLTSGELWGKFADKFFNGKTLEFSDVITGHPGYQMGPGAHGRATKGRVSGFAEVSA